MQSRTKIYGPPGTGKTTYCLDLLCEHLQAGDKVLFVSFTRAAKLEAQGRLIKLFGEVPDHATISTVHALCLKITGIGVDCLADRPNVQRKFMDLLGVANHGNQKDRLLASIGFYGRIRNMESNWDQVEDVPFGSPESVRDIVQQFEDWKKKEGYVDFTDLLQRVARGEGEVPTYDVVIIDEAQDLTTLQWRVVDRFYEKASTVYVVGDDDQTVYSFLGADVGRFLTWPCDAVRVLEHSYRLPKNVLAYSQLLAKQIKFRQDKKVTGPDTMGHIYKDIHILEDINYGARKSEMYLTRNQYMMRRVSKLLLQEGIPFKGSYSPFTDVIGYGGRVFQAIRVLHGWRDNNLTTKEWRAMKSVLRPELVTLMVDRFPAATEFREEGIPALKAIFKGEDFETNGWWEIFFPTLSAKLASAFRLALKRYSLDYCADPALELSTIHGAKGKEADRVYVCSALTDRLYRTMESKDDEHRLFYVGVTRTRDELFILHDEEAGVRKYQFPKL